MVRVNVKVETDAEEFGIETGNIPIIHLTEKPRNGRANVQLVNSLHEILGEKPGLVSGHSSKRKKIAINMDEDTFRRRLEDYNG